MERRSFKRIYIGLKAELIADGKLRKGVIENLSENGINIMTYSVPGENELIPEALLELNLHPDTTERLNLQCTVKWSFKNPTHGLTQNVGMEIMNPPWDESINFL
ncbi:MAG: PilZ domain-containing protein [bacterium]